MTVVSTIISQYCTVHASDSFITIPENGGIHRIVEEQRTKIVPVKHWRGAMAYYGWAGPVKSDGSNGIMLDYEQSTLKWLQKQAARARDFQSAEEFANYVANQLNERIKETNFDREIGIGIHFSAYEKVAEYWIPELFHITNYLDTDYKALRSTGVRLTRETYCSIHRIDWTPEDRNDLRRLEVRDYLRGGKMLIYNNGDPEMFNPIAEVILQSIKEISTRKLLINPKNPDTYRNLATIVVKIVCDLQRAFVVKGKRVIGGKPHDYVIPANGEPWSKTGDA